MDHHRCFKAWIKKKGAERDTDTFFKKHKYLTNPKITPEDKVVAVAKILTQTIKVNVTGESEEMEALEKVAEIFETIAKRNPQKQKERHHNEHVIRLPRRTNAQFPRVDKMNAQNSRKHRVEEPPPRVDASPGLIVAYPTEAVDKASKEARPTQDHRNHRKQDEEEAPARNTQERKGTRSITHELMMSAVEMATAQPTPRKLASRKFPMQMLFEMAGSIMDVNGNLLEYINLMKRVEYRNIWGKAYGNELGRLAQGIGDNIKGIDTISSPQNKTYLLKDKETSHTVK